MIEVISTRYYSTINQPFTILHSIRSPNTIKYVLNLRNNILYRHTNRNRMASSKFIEILDNTTTPIAQQHQMSSSDVKLEDVLADQEATIQQRSRSSTQSSSSRKSHEYTTSAGYNPRQSMSRDDSQSPSSSSVSSPSSSATSSPTSPVPKLRKLRKFTLSGGFGR